MEQPLKQSATGSGSDQPPPRAFAQGTGILLQILGMALFLSTCCVCSFAGAWDPVLSRPEILRLLEEESSVGVGVRGLFEQPAKAGVMLMVMFMTIGGLALAGFGLGLQAERPRSAWGALGTTVAMIVILALAGIGIWVGEASWTSRIMHGLLSLTMIVVLGFVWVALREVLASPPPPVPTYVEPDADPSI